MEKAAQMHRKALAIFRATLDPSHRYLAVCLGDLGKAEYLLGHRDEGIRLLRESVKILRASPGADQSHNLLIYLECLARAELGSGLVDVGRAHLDEALSMALRLDGPEGPTTDRLLLF